MIDADFHFLPVSEVKKHLTPLGRPIGSKTLLLGLFNATLERTVGGGLVHLVPDPSGVDVWTQENTPLGTPAVHSDIVCLIGIATETDVGACTYTPPNPPCRPFQRVIGLAMDGAATEVRGILYQGFWELDQVRPTPPDYWFVHDVALRPL